MCQWHIIRGSMRTNEGGRIDRLYNRLNRLKQGATAIQAGVIEDYQDYILGNYAQIRREETVLEEYFDNLGMATGDVMDDDEEDDD